MRLFLKNGKIVTATDIYKGDILIEDEKIRAIGKSLQITDALKIDCTGKLIMPGAIDAHVHFQLPFCGTVSADDFENGTKAAACGGVTTIIDYAIQTKGKPIMKAVEARRKEADGKVAVDYSLHAAITGWDEKTKAEIKEVVEYGIPSFKVFMIYAKEGWMCDDGMFFEALETSKKSGGTILVHAESVFILEKLIERYSTQLKKVKAYGHTLSRPDFTEYEAVSRAAMWAEVTGGRLYIVHMSAGRSAQIVKEAQERGVNIWAETCPQYLLLTDNVFKKKDGHLYATCPQLKKESDRQRLWQGVEDGEIGFIATDTCTFNKKQKAMWKGDFRKIPFGMPGVETMLPLMYSEGVEKKRISLNRLVQLVSTNPAKLHGLYPNKGTIAPGADADIVIYDPKRKVKLGYKKLQTNCDWSPYEGLAVKGYPALTLSRGKIVAKEGKFCGESGWGKFVKRKPNGKI